MLKCFTVKSLKLIPHQIGSMGTGVIMQKDDSVLQHAHTAHTTMTKIQELGGIELPPHPVYSPDLVPLDYRLFRSMVHFLCGRNFENIEDVEVDITESSHQKPEIINLAE